MDISLPRWASTEAGLVVDVVPGDLVLRPRGNGGPDREDQLLVEGSLQ